MKKANQLIARLETLFPGISLLEDNGWGDNVIVGGECAGSVKVDGVTLRFFDYYAEDYREETYRFGVYIPLCEAVEAAGWHWEWNDAGTCLCYYDG